MKKKKFFLLRWIDWLSEISGYLSGIAIFLAALIVFEAVVLRYFLKMSSVWQTELSLFLLIFATFVGGAYGLKHDAHVGMDLFVIRLSTKAQLVLKTFVAILCMILIVTVGWKAWGMWWEATINGWHSETLWGPPLTFPYFILPLGMTLIALQYIVIICDNILQFIELRKESGEVRD